MDPKEVIKQYRAIGYAQILPALVCLGFTILLSAIALIFSLRPSIFGRNMDDLIRLAIVLTIALFIIFGLTSFFISSYQFIKSKKHSDYELLVKGMAHLNRAWLSLCVFSIVSTSFTLYILYYVINYGYF